MPTERFTRLGEQKKQAIRDAAIKEFANVPFEKASINKIIQNANISRGSFYTYFEDKQDVLDFIFEDVHDRCNEFMKVTLEENGGDYFDTMIKFLDFCLDLFENRKFFDLAKNVFVFYRGTQSFLGPNHQPDDELRAAHAKEMLECTDLSAMRFKEVDDFVYLSSLCMANLAMTLMAFYQGEYDRESLHEKYKKGLDILKYGSLSIRQDSLYKCQ